MAIDPRTTLNKRRANQKAFDVPPNEDLFAFVVRRTDWDPKKAWPEVVNRRGSRSYARCITHRDGVVASTLFLRNKRELGHALYRGWVDVTDLWKNGPVVPEPVVTAPASSEASQGLEGAPDGATAATAPATPASRMAEAGISLTKGDLRKAKRQTMQAWAKGLGIDARQKNDLLREAISAAIWG